MESISSSESLKQEQKDDKYIDKIKELYYNKKNIFSLIKCDNHNINESHWSIEHLNTNNYYNEKRRTEISKITNFINSITKIPKKQIREIVKKKNIKKFILQEKIKNLIKF